MPVIPPVLPSPPIISSTRIANDLMIEISGHLVEDVVNATLGAGVAAGVQTVAVSSTTGMYAGAQVVLAKPDGSASTILTISAFDPVALTLTANFSAPYPAASSLLGGTFPTQQPSDPLFTQTEILAYLARAQNEFLTKVPCIFGFSTQNVNLGEEFQALPPTAIELERVSINGTRLYEIAQMDLSMADPQAIDDTTTPTPTNWFEDRTGYYGWGLDPVPQAGFACELICSQRGPTALILTSLLAVPDAFAHFIKYKALAYCWQKDGEQRSPTMARIAEQRFDSGVAIASRFLDGVVNAPGKRA